MRANMMRSSSGCWTSGNELGVADIGQICGGFNAYPTGNEIGSICRWRHAQITRLPRRPASHRDAGMADKRFARSVVYICAHSATGAMGIVINKLANEVSFRDLLVQLDIVQAQNEPDLPGGVDNSACIGAGRWRREGVSCSTRMTFIIENATLAIDDGIC
jgi:hypothetical protein